MKRKIMAIVALISVTALVLCGCSASPKQTADSFMQAIKNKDLEKLASVYAVDQSEMENTAYGLVDSSTDDTAFVDREGLDKYKQYMDKLFEFDYELSNEQIDGEKATVDVKIKAYNYGAAFSSAYSTVLSQALIFAFSQDEAGLNTFMEQTFLSEFSKVEKTSEMSATLNLVKKDKKWVVEDISENTAFINALTGGLYNAAKAVSGE